MATDWAWSFNRTLREVSERIPETNDEAYAMLSHAYWHHRNISSECDFSAMSIISDALRALDEGKREVADV